MDTLFAPLNKAFLDVLTSLWWLWVILFLLLCLSIVQSWIENRRIARSGIFEIDKMDGITFERYLGILFTKLGYKVQRTQASGDFGADLVIQKDKIRTIVQAKRYHKNVGVRAIQEVVAAQRMYKGAKTLVVTNSQYTKQAHKLAEVNQVELWDRTQLVRHILLSQKGEVQEKKYSTL